MKTWEYKVEQMDPPDLRLQRNYLRRMGGEGWDLICVSMYRNKPVLYLKRPAEND